MRGCHSAKWRAGLAGRYLYVPALYSARSSHSPTPDAIHMNRYLLIATLPAIGTGTALGVYGNDAAAAIFAGGVFLLFVAGFRAVGLGRR